MLIILLFYTIIIFSFVLYLVYLRVYHLSRYTDTYTSFLINFNFYLTLFYVFAFVFSIFLTFVMYTAQLTGVALAAIIHEIPVDVLTHPTIVNSELISQSDPEVQTVDINKPEFKTTGPKTASESTWKSWAGEKISSSTGVLKETLLTPVNAGKRAYVEQVARIAMYESESLSSNTEKIAKNMINNHLNLKNTVLASDIGINTQGIKAPHFYTSALDEEGKVRLYECIDGRCLLDTYKHQVFVSGAKDRIAGNATWGLNKMLNFGEFSGPRCREILPGEYKLVAGILGTPELQVTLGLNKALLLPPSIDESLSSIRQT